MKKLLLLLLVGGVGFVLLAVMGYINVPGLTPQPTPAPQAEKLEPPKEKPPEKGPAPEAKRDPLTSAPAPVAPKPESRSEPAKPAYPPIAPNDVENARRLYANAKWGDVDRALAGCEKPEVGDGPSTQQARALVRKARLLDVLTQRIKRNKIGSAKKLEQITLNQGGTMLGVVEDLGGDRLRITRIGNSTAEVKVDDIAERTPAAPGALREKLLDRLRDKESRIKGDDAFGNMRLGHYCWEYGLDPEAVPYLDKAVESDDFPVIARVFGGPAAQKLVDGWYVFSGKGPKTEPATGDTSLSGPAKPAKPAEPAKPASPAVGSLSKARERYDLGVEKYKVSFGDSSEAQANLKSAHEYFKQARDALGDADDAAADELRMQISRLLFDCSKRSAIN